MFAYIAEELTKTIHENFIISTIGLDALCNHSDKPLENLTNCNHEEADTRIFVHAKDAYFKGYNSILIRTVDTDVVILAINVLNHIPLNQLWIHFSVGKNARYIPVHEIYKELSEAKSRILPLFHALTACDQTSSFATRSKKSAWSTWKMYPELTGCLEKISYCPSQEQLEQAMPVIECFVILLYDRISECSAVNEARKDLFARKGRSIKSVPPTQDALLNHLKRAAF